MKNRSVPADVILPHFTYRNVAAALGWLTNGAQTYLGGAWIMVNAGREGRCTPAELGCATQSLTIFVDDVDAHFRKSKSAGAKIVEELHETIYGERQYGAEDLDGHRWLFSQHARDVSPDEWGARIANPPVTGR